MSPAARSHARGIARISAATTWPDEADVALALWVLHTWVSECFDITPYLAITSPTPRCGKTVLMTMLYWLCCRAKKTDSMSKAVIYRSVDADRPTLVLDEVNWICSLDDERAGIVNGGFVDHRFGLIAAPSPSQS
jgi:putative DNA primase/helicase